MFKKLPYGTIRLTDSLYIDKQPIKVSDYLEFLSDIRNSYTPKMHDSIRKLPLFGLSPKIAYHLYDSLPMDSVFYKRMITRIWQTVGNDRFEFGVDYRLTSAKYYNYPIVNVNYYQIFEYCKWRTDKVKMFYAVKSRNLRQRKKYPINFIYRIVKRKEWEKAMGTFFSNIGKLTNSRSNTIMNNIASPYQASKNFSYESTNAAEYLDDEIITIGFNWINAAGLGDVSYMNFEKNTDWISFRCMCEILPDTVNKPIIPKAKPLPKSKKKVKPKKKERKIKGIKTEKAKRKRH